MSLEVAIRRELGAFSLDVAFAASDARVTALFGPSGAGKSSVLSVIAGLGAPAKGRVAIQGRVVLDSEAGIFVPPRQRRIGYVFQDARLFPHIDVEDNLLFGWMRNGRKASGDEIRHIITLLGLEDLLSRKPLTLSGGEKSRVALGRALLVSPDLLLLDEPLAALDAGRRAEILPYLERLHDETRIPIVYVSHALDEVTRLADDIVVLKNGRVAVQGSVHDLATALDARAQLGAAPMGAVLETQVAAHREADGLSVLAFDGGMLTVPLLERAAGTRVRARVRAEDIMLALEEPRAVSANNVLAVRIVAVAPGDGPHADVQLSCGNTRFVARITRASVRRLNLAAGQDAFAVLKSVTVDV